jgi:protein tyrosine/serine phosphatase
LIGGGVTASGVLLRTDNLQGLTPSDVSLLIDELGVRVVVDLRTGEEVELEGPGPLVGRVTINHRSLYPEKGRLTDVMISRNEREHGGESLAVQYYLRYLEDRPDSVVGALEDIASGPGPVIVHCAAGKDRTGVVVALALSVAGVERAAIVEDYVRTGERITGIMKRLRASSTYAADLADVTDESRKPQAEYISRVLQVLDSRDGGPVAWLESHGFDPAALRTRLRGG